MGAASFWLTSQSNARQVLAAPWLSSNVLGIQLLPFAVTSFQRSSLLAKESVENSHLSQLHEAGLPVTLLSVSPQSHGHNLIRRGTVKDREAIGSWWQRQVLSMFPLTHKSFLLFHPLLLYSLVKVDCCLQNTPQKSEAWLTKNISFFLMSRFRQYNLKLGWQRLVSETVALFASLAEPSLTKGYRFSHYISSWHLN